MGALPAVVDDGLSLRDGIWCRSGNQPHERWSAEAEIDPVHAAISTSGSDAERAKSLPDVEFFVKRAVDGVVLDLGCGYGRMAKYVLPLRGFDGYVGLDGSMTMLRLFRERHDASALEQRTPLLLMHGTIDEIKLPDASVDNVVISAVLLHNPKPAVRAAVREVHRVLRPGGMLFVLSDLPNSHTLATLPNQAYVTALAISGRGERNGPVRPYSFAEVHALFGDFENVSVEKRGHAVLPKRVLGLPRSWDERYRSSVHDPISRWAERRLSPALLDRFYGNVRVTATR